MAKTKTTGNNEGGGEMKMFAKQKEKYHGPDISSVVLNMVGMLIFFVASPLGKALGGSGLSSLGWIITGLVLFGIFVVARDTAQSYGQKIGRENYLGRLVEVTDLEEGVPHLFKKDKYGLFWCLVGCDDLADGDLPLGARWCCFEPSQIGDTMPLIGARILIRNGDSLYPINGTAKVGDKVFIYEGKAYSI